MATVLMSSTVGARPSSASATELRGGHAVAVRDDLVASVDHLRVGRFSEIVPVRRVKSVAEHSPSDPGPDGVASLYRDSPARPSAEGVAPGLFLFSQRALPVRYRNRLPQRPSQET